MVCFAAISNISSPDYHDDDSVDIRDCLMEISDHSDSDSTLLGPEPGKRRGIPRNLAESCAAQGDHKIVIQVRGPQEKRSHGNGEAVGYSIELQVVFRASFRLLQNAAWVCRTTLRTKAGTTRKSRRHYRRRTRATLRACIASITPRKQSTCLRPFD